MFAGWICLTGVQLSASEVAAIDISHLVAGVETRDGTVDIVGWACNCTLLGGFILSSYESKSKVESSRYLALR